MTAVLEAPRAPSNPRPVDPVRPHPGAASDLVLLVIFVVSLLVRGNPSAMWVAVVYMIVVPGDLLRRAIGIRPRTLGERFVYAVAGSLAVQILACMVVEGLSLIIGVGKPFSRGPLLFGELIVVVGLVMSAHRDGGAGPGPSPQLGSAGGAMMACCPPVLVLLGVPFLDNGRGPGLVLAAFAVSVLLLLRAVTSRTSRLREQLPLLVFALALAVLWSFSLRSTYLYGFDIHQEYSVLSRTISAQMWRPIDGSAFNSTLSLTSLPAALHALTGVSGYQIFKVVYPAIFACFPTAVFVLLRFHAGPTVSLFAVLALAMTPAGFWQITGVARQEVALVIFVGMMLLLLHADGTRRARTLLGSVLGLTCVLAHYSTAYIAIAVLAGTVVATWVMTTWSRRPRAQLAISPVIPLLMMLLAFGWYSVLNQSTDNVSKAGASYAASGPGLRGGSNPIDSYLKGTTATQSSPQELFAASRLQVVDRPWLKAYSAAVQSDFPAVNDPAPSAGAVVAGLQGPADLGYTVFRQLLNLTLILGAVLLAIRTLRARGGRPSAIPPETVAIVLTAVAVTAVIRLSTSLSLSYNAERLAVQMSPLLGIALVVVLSSAAHKWRGRGARALVAVVVVGGSALALLDTTGVRALIAGGVAGNLQTQGEHLERYYEHPEDAAAADWLAARFQPTNMVYSDRYGALFLQDHPRFTRGGLLDLITPALLDQRAFVFATTENLETGRARGYLNGTYTTYQYPTNFLMRYKALVYDNGSAGVFD